MSPSSGPCVQHLLGPRDLIREELPILGPKRAKSLQRFLKRRRSFIGTLVAALRSERVVAPCHYRLRRFLAQGAVRSLRLFKSCASRADPAKRKFESPDQPMSGSNPLGAQVKLMSKC